MKDFENKEKKINNLTVYAPIVYMGAIVFGIILDNNTSFKLSQNYSFEIVGFLLIILSTFLIFWAQYTLYYFRNTKIKQKIKIDSFSVGPYKFIKHPTYLGLGLMLLGLGLLINSLFLTILAILSFLFVYFIILKKEESLLEKKYGEHYLNYKKKTKL